MSDAVTLREITRETVYDILALKVAPGPEHLVMPLAPSLAAAQFQPESWCRGIYRGDTPVGFVMLLDRPDTGATWLWRLLIDGQYQREGIGARAMAEIIAHVRTLLRTTELFTSHEPGDQNPGPFYEKLGFVYTGETDPDGELIMRLAIR